MRNASNRILFSMLIASAIFTFAKNPCLAEETATQVQSDFSVLLGRWIRPDGGYTIIVKSANADGTLEATYFNPGPLPFSKAQATMDANTLNVFLELRAGGYAGSTYTLKFDRETDRLVGAYFQAVAQQRFNIYFVRAK